MKKVMIILIGIAMFMPLKAEEVTIAQLMRTIKELKAEIARLDNKIKRDVKTVYKKDGRVVNQKENAAGYHRVAGQTKLVSGVDTVTINTSVQNGKRDLSFQSAGTYRGIVTALGGSVSVTYRIRPISGTKFVIESSSGTDTATVKYMVEGE